MKFLVYHQYDVDGGFGDAIGQTQLIGILTADTEEEARAWAEKHTHKVVYDVPYNALHLGELIVRPADSIKDYTVNDCPWDEQELNRLKYLEKHSGCGYDYDFGVDPEEDGMQYDDCVDYEEQDYPDDLYEEPAEYNVSD